jgi:hypothetical protein
MSGYITVFYVECIFTSQEVLLDIAILLQNRNNEIRGI